MKFLRAWAQSPGPSAGGGGGGPGPSGGLSRAKAAAAVLSMPARAPGSPARVAGAGRSERAPAAPRSAPLPAASSPPGRRGPPGADVGAANFLPPLGRRARSKLLKRELLGPHAPS